VYREVPGTFGNCKSTLITISHLPALLPVAGHRQRRPPAPSRPSRPSIRHALAPTRRGRAPPPPVASRWRLHPSPRRPAAPRTSPTAATSPPPWSAPCRARRSLLASARAIEEPQRPNPLALLLYPRSHTPEHRRGAATPGPLHPDSPHL